MSAAQNPNTSPKVRRNASGRKRAGSHLPPHKSQESHDNALNQIRAFLKGRICYDAFPISFRLIVLDTKLNVKRALQCLLLNGVVSAPLWNSAESKFAGMLTVLDIIHLIQWYWRNSSIEDAAKDVDTFRLESLRDIEKSLGVAQPPLLHNHPSGTLYDAARLLIQTHARRLPLLDHDTETGHEVIVSVLTQYRLLKFISINCQKEISLLHLPLRKLRIGTYVCQQFLDPSDPNYNPYYPLATATLASRVFDIVHIFSGKSVSAVPIIDEEGIVVNLYETVDIISLVRAGDYQRLDVTIAEALKHRAPDFPGVVVCGAGDSLGSLLELIKKRRVHRLVVVEGEEEERKGGKKGRLLGLITLSDVLRYVIGNVDIGEGVEPKDMPLTSQSSSINNTPTMTQPTTPSLEGPPSTPGSTESAQPWPRHFPDDRDADEIMFSQSAPA